MRNIHLILVLAASLLPFATARAAPADLPETGQTECSDAAGAGIACATTGQDGDLKAGVAWPNPRFVVNDCGTPAVTGDDVVTDNLTGLMWRGAPESIPVNWIKALEDTDVLTHCGFSDWRLPNINELGSLMNSEAANQAIFLNTQGFNSVQAESHWSSSSFAGNADRAWVVSMENGNVSTGAKSGGRFVWPVRAGQ